MILNKNLDLQRKLLISAISILLVIFVALSIFFRDSSASENYGLYIQIALLLMLLNVKKHSICIKCGYSVQDDSKYCNNCGLQLHE